MEKHKYQKYKYKIDPKDLEEIIGATHVNPDVEVRIREDDFESKVYLDHYLMFDENGVIDNPDGCYYFNDVDELVFPEYIDKDKAMVRTEIEKHKMSADTRLFGGLYDET